MEAQPAGWSRLFTDLTFLSGIGAGGGAVQAEPCGIA